VTAPPATRWRRGRRLGWSWWPLLVAAWLGQLGLVGLAVVEYLRLDWLASEPADLAFVGLTAASGVSGLAVAATVLVGAGRAGAGLRRLLRAAGRPVPGPVRAAAEPLGVAGRVRMVAAAEPFAVTYGVWRPRVLLSTGLLAALDRAELAAVLAHEACHLRRRDPLGLLAARVLAGYAYFLPVAGWLAERSALARELAADRAAAAWSGVPALAGAMLKLADATGPAVGVAAGGRHRWEARISQLEGRRLAGRPRLGRLRLVATAGNACLLATAGFCCVGLAAAVLPAAGSGMPG
jgi:Zn-dependent protease with chaperone function